MSPIPNILTESQEHHAWCHEPAERVEDWGHVGDVRRCVHRKVQLAYDGSSRYVAVIPPYWRDLSPIFNPVLYRRARRVLDAPAS